MARRGAPQSDEAQQDGNGQHVPREPTAAVRMHRRRRLLRRSIQRQLAQIKGRLVHLYWPGLTNTLLAATLRLPWASRLAWPRTTTVESSLTFSNSRALFATGLPLSSTILTVAMLS